MANDLPELVARWQCKQYSVIIPAATGILNAIPADPERLAIGFVHIGNSNVFASPVAGGNITYGEWIRGNTNRWFYWQKHGSMVNQAWSFSTDLAGPDAVGVCEIVRTAVGS